MNNSKLEIVVGCCKRDYFLAKICIASIRFYYPDIIINLVKDEFFGKFNTKKLEEGLNVQIMDLGYRNYGWGFAKIALLLSKIKEPNKKYLFLDADIILVGKVLDNIIPHIDNADFIVSPELTSYPETDWFKSTYYDLDQVKTIYSDFECINYTFNTGQIVITPGMFSAEELSDFIDVSRFPYWKNSSALKLPCVDQSLLNIILPRKHVFGDLILEKVDFMIWSGFKDRVNNLEFDKVISGSYPFLIHYAGDRRTPFLNEMIRSDLLIFFQDFYFSSTRTNAICRYKELLWDKKIIPLTIRLGSLKKRIFARRLLY